jgi:hypothetical protein
MKALLRYPENERRATGAGVNLFFSALLGANVGMMNDLPLNDYFKMILLLTGAVTSVFTIAVSERRSVIWSSGAALAIILVGMGAAFPMVAEASRQQFYRLIMTIAVWLAMLLILRFTPELPNDTSLPARDKRPIVPLD